MRTRRGGRAVEGSGLENRRGFTPPVGSNPTLSATPSCHARNPIHRVVFATAVVALAATFGACSAAEEAPASAQSAEVAEAAATPAAECEIGTIGCAVPETHNASVRNMTSSPIPYESRPAGTTGDSVVRELGVATIDSFPRDTPIELRFVRDGAKVVYVLDPATAYSFRSVA
jgi:hypothetical protein